MHIDEIIVAGYLHEYHVKDGSVFKRSDALIRIRNECRKHGFAPLHERLSYDNTHIKPYEGVLQFSSTPFVLEEISNMLHKYIIPQH